MCAFVGQNRFQSAGVECSNAEFRIDFAPSQKTNFQSAGALQSNFAQSSTNSTTTRKRKSRWGAKPEG